jgi:uncharacterized membrane protein
MTSAQTLNSPASPRGSHNGHPATETNMSEAERWLSLIGGGVLAWGGLRRGSLSGLGLAALGGTLVARGLTGHCPCYQLLGINTAGPTGPKASVAAGSGVRVDKSITIHRSAEDLFHFWRNLENLPRILCHLKSVRASGDVSHWKARTAMGSAVEWDAVVINEEPNHLLAWRSLPGADVDSAGSVHFIPLFPDRGTEVRVELKYYPAAGKLGWLASKLLGQDPERQIVEDLQRFKQIMESGAVPMSPASDSELEPTFSA